MAKSKLVKELAELEALLQERLKVIELNGTTRVHTRDMHDPDQSPAFPMHEPSGIGGSATEAAKMPNVVPSKPVVSDELSLFFLPVMSPMLPALCNPGPDEMETLPHILPEEFMHEVPKGEETADTHMEEEEPATWPRLK